MADLKIANDCQIVQENKYSSLIDDVESEEENILGNDPRIEFMLKVLPKLDELFEIHSCIGSGTFSSVYLSTLKIEKDLLFSDRQKFAIKYLLPTSHPKRIERELMCLQKVGGFDNVVKLYFCMRSLDSVVFVMPYLEHDDFMLYLLDMGPAETQLYLKNLLLALRRVHQFNIIHRDVKPDNFLYDRNNKEFLLVDMGLAHSAEDKTSSMPKLTFSKIDSKRKRSSDCENGYKDEVSPVQRAKKRISLNYKEDSRPNTLDKFILKSPLKQSNSLNNLNNNNSLPKTSLTISNNRNSLTKLFVNANSVYTPQNKTFSYSSPKPNRVTNLLNFNTSLNEAAVSNVQSKTHNTENNKNIILSKKGDKSIIQSSEKTSGNNKVKYNTNARLRDSRKSLLALKSSIQNSNKNKTKSNKNCDCLGKSSVCFICRSRKPIPANRNGTRGFRPPEVLLKFTDQTTAVDIWAVGIILLCILSKCYPFFDAPDDLTALAEQIALFGTARIKNLAKLLDRSITMGCPDLIENDLKEVCNILRNRDCPNQSNLKNKTKNVENFPDSVYDLLTKLLDVNPFTRITAADALNHPFFSENLM